jgi:hypothetical protein
MQISVLGSDLGKNSCSVVGLDDRGRVEWSRRCQRCSMRKGIGPLPAGADGRPASCYSLLGSECPDHFDCVAIMQDIIGAFA